MFCAWAEYIGIINYKKRETDRQTRDRKKARDRRTKRRKEREAGTGSVRNREL